MVFASPHSGSDYSPEFIAASRLDPLTLRFSEDAFVDEIYAAAQDLGAPLLAANFPRAFLDPNREAYELDPSMFIDDLPDYVNSTSPRVAGGLGSIAKVVTSGEEIYQDKLHFAEAKARIQELYDPYHKALRDLLDETKSRFGCCLLIDCHSMPSVGGPMDSDPGRKRVDMVLGDCHGETCVPLVTKTVERSLKAMGYNVRRNEPYSGGFTTRHYGNPQKSIHVLQIEINRALYMDETTVIRSPELPGLRNKIRDLIQDIIHMDWQALKSS